MYKGEQPFTSLFSFFLYKVETFLRFVCTIYTRHKMWHKMWHEMWHTMWHKMWHTMWHEMWHKNTINSIIENSKIVFYKKKQNSGVPAPFGGAAHAL